MYPQPSATWCSLLSYARSRLTKKAEPPPTRGVNRDSGTASANGGWLRRLVRPRVIIHMIKYQSNNSGLLGEQNQTLVSSQAQKMELNSGNFSTRISPFHQLSLLQRCDNFQQTSSYQTINPKLRWWEVKLVIDGQLIDHETWLKKYPNHMGALWLGFQIAEAALSDPSLYLYPETLSGIQTSLGQPFDATSGASPCQTPHRIFGTTVGVSQATGQTLV